MSKQRCIVIHATHNVTVDSNIAFNTSGHCFMTEEGGEQDNTFINNLGIVTNGVVKKIADDETDDEPSTFWLASPFSSVIGNVGAGSANSAFWWELRPTVRGLSLGIPSLNWIKPFNNPLGPVVNNVAHSNNRHGLRTYPHGVQPHGPAGASLTSTISGLLAYKNNGRGMLVHSSNFVTVTNCTLADNGLALVISNGDSNVVRDSRIVATTTNYGNPMGCTRNSIWSKCRPVSSASCTFPLAMGVQGRSVGALSNRIAPFFGLVIGQGTNMQGNNTFQNIRFANFDSTCWKAAAIIAMTPASFWSTANLLQDLRFTSNSQRLWFPPQGMTKIDGYNAIPDGGQQTPFHMFLDEDGSTTGTRGYTVINDTRTLPVGKKGCVAKPSWNAYTCAGVCYRTVKISYIEPGFTASYANADFTHGTYSSLKITRLADGAAYILDGNLNDYEDLSTTGIRMFFANLLSNEAYQVEVLPGKKDPSFIPASVRVQYYDAYQCDGGMIFQFKQLQDKPVTIANSDNVYYKQCPGNDYSASPSTVFTATCNHGVQWLQFSMSADFPSSIYVVRGSSPGFSANCLSTSQCSMLWSGSPWLYDASGLERRPAFYNPIISYPKNWQHGVAPFGIGLHDTRFVTRLPPPIRTVLATYYFHTSFRLEDSACYSMLQVEAIAVGGLVIYLNNKELLRSNMPDGKVTNSTMATAAGSNSLFQTFRIPLTTASQYSLVEGTNTVAVEFHMAYFWTTGPLFNLRVSGIRASSCSGATSSPEICDGIDNDNDGKVDKTADGRPLTQPCSTPCGTGLATCINGLFQNCSAKPALSEVCDGVDNDCDGFVDNGPNQMDCHATSVCYQGRCLPVMNGTVAQPVVTRRSAGWSYNDNGINLDASTPGWRTSPAPSWRVGTGPFGFGNIPFKTSTNCFKCNKKLPTTFFIRTFKLTADDITNTHNIVASVERVDGAVVYINGVELWRTNINWGPITGTTTAIGANPATYQSYFPCDQCFHNTTKTIKVGTNVIAAELHGRSVYQGSAVFDMDLIRNAYTSCHSLPGSPPTCVRQLVQTLLPPSATWKVLDGRLELPAVPGWIAPDFDDSHWPSGIAPLGYGSSGLIKTQIESTGVNEAGPRTTIYFRKTFNVPDAACYFQLNGNLLAYDGAIVYLNGAELYRKYVPAKNVTYATPALGLTYGGYVLSSNLAAGWLRSGQNVIAVELHRSTKATVAGFDLELLGNREAVTCSPAPQ